MLSATMSLARPQAAIIAIAVLLTAGGQVGAQRPVTPVNPQTPPRFRPENSAPRLQITQIDPKDGKVGMSGLNLFVTGVGFTSESTVVWNSAPLSTRFVSSTQLVATIP